MNHIEPGQIRQRRPRLRMPVKIPNYVIEEINTIGTSQEITDFLNERGIYSPAATCFKELNYCVLDFKGIKKSFKAAACQNQKFGWQLLSRHYCGCIGKEAITIFPGNPKKVTIFENQYNYLIWKAGMPTDCCSAIILNSFLLLNDVIQAAKVYSDITLLLQRNPAGLKAADTIIRCIPYARDNSCQLYDL